MIETSAVKNEGFMEAAEAAVKMALQGGKTTPQHVFSKPVEDTLDRIGEIADNFIAQENKRWYAVKLFERDEKALESLKLPQGPWPSWKRP